MESALSLYLKSFKNIFFPNLCFACEKKIPQGYLCGSCKEKIDFLHPPLCQLCSSSIIDNETQLCKSCRTKTISYNRLISITAYKAPMVNLIHLFKYKNYDYLGELFSGLMIEHLKNIGFNLSYYDFITPVPLHPLKFKERGYNQSAILAEKLARYFQIPFINDIIYEKKYHISQTKLSKDARKKNLESAFIVKENLANKRVILVDDIFTTGTTLNECASALKEKTAEEITAITLCKA